MRLIGDTRRGWSQVEGPHKKIECPYGSFSFVKGESHERQEEEGRGICLIRLACRGDRVNLKRSLSLPLSVPLFTPFLHSRHFNDNNTRRTLTGCWGERDTHRACDYFIYIVCDPAFSHSSLAPPASQKKQLLDVPIPVTLH